MNAEVRNETVMEVPAAAEAEHLGSGGRLLKHELEHLKADWWWFLLLGLLLVFLGIIAIAYPAVFTAGAIIVLGILLIVGGGATIISSLWAGKWSALLLQLLMGILYLVAGMAIMDAPAESIVVMTLFVAAFFIVAGLFRIVSAMLLRFSQWGWVLLNGVVTLLLGIIIYRQWPEASVWVLGLLIGVDMLFYGWTWIMMSLGLRRLPVTANRHGTAPGT